MCRASDDCASVAGPRQARESNGLACDHRYRLYHRASRPARIGRLGARCDGQSAGSPRSPHRDSRAAGRLAPWTVVERPGTGALSAVDRHRGNGLRAIDRSSPSGRGLPASKSSGPIGGSPRRRRHRVSGGHARTVPRRSIHHSRPQVLRPVPPRRTGECGHSCSGCRLGAAGTRAGDRPATNRSPHV